MIINLDLNTIIIFLVIGLAAGFIANSVMGRRSESLLSNLVLGVAGAFVGGFLLPAIGLRPWGLIGNFLTAIAGAVVIIAISRLLSNTSSKRS